MPMTIDPILVSNLFGGREAATTRESKRPIHVLERFRLRNALLIPFFAEKQSTSSTVAVTTSRSFRASWDALKTLPWKAFIRPTLWIVGVSVSISLLIEYINAQKRQAVDATSEWRRYASNPAARGRAIMTILFRLFPFVIREKLCRTPELKRQIRMESGAYLATSLLRLGPLYIKLGQIVSCQDNWLSSEWIESLERLQDRVPAKSGEEAMELAYSAMGSKERFDEVFSSFDDKPLAAASLGQVHKAVLRRNNAEVAVKLQRPNLKTIYDRDLELLMKIARIVDRIIGVSGGVGGVSQSWTDIFSNAKEILYREIDYRDEASNAVRFARDFGIGLNGAATRTSAMDKAGEQLDSAAPWLRTPYVYEDLSTEKVLVMEMLPSIKITDFERLDEANVTMQDRQVLADNLARTYLRSFCTNRFFSTDPHPGNLGVELIPNKPPRLVMYDFGQACALQQDQSDGILDVIEAIMDLDSDRCVTAFQKMGVLKADADLDLVRAKVKDNFETGKIIVKNRQKRRASHSNSRNTISGHADGVPTPPPTSSSSIETSNDRNKQAPKDSEVVGFFTLPAEYAFVARALTQMDGVGKALDPDFDFISSAAPYIVEIKGATNYLKDEFDKRMMGLKERLGLKP